MLPICATDHAQQLRQRLTPIAMLQINITMCGRSDASLPELPRHSDPTGAGRMHKSPNGMVWYGMVWYGMVWYGMVEVCEGAPVAVSGWVLTMLQLN